jgi:hypothetical protein
MTMSDNSETPKNDKNAPGPDANNLQHREPHRVVHHAKTETHSGTANPRHASLFKPRIVSSPKMNDQPDPVAEGMKDAGLPTPAGTTDLSGDGTSLNPGQRLRTLENAGKDPLPDQQPAASVVKPSDSTPPKTPRPSFKIRILPNGEKTRRAFWDVGTAISLIINIILLVAVFFLSVQINKLKISSNNLLSGMFNNFVRMDNSVISTTINMPDVPIPLNFNLPVVQSETYVTLTRSVTIKSARVTINSGALTLDNAPATITLPMGTNLPVSLEMDVPVQTTVHMNLAIPVNIKLADANSPDVNVGNLHTALLGLQDTIGPLYCQFNPQAQDYLNNFLCDAQGNYIVRSAAP